MGENNEVLMEKRASKLRLGEKKGLEMIETQQAEMWRGEEGFPRRGRGRVWRQE